MIRPVPETIRSTVTGAAASGIAVPGYQPARVQHRPP